jgi:hypothetical protein
MTVKTNRIQCRFCGLWFETEHIHECYDLVSATTGGEDDE